MIATLSNLVKRLDDPIVAETNIIPWSSPVPSFGDLSKSLIATIGLNPSNREFVDPSGRELDGQLRRFHTLKSLGLNRWSDASREQLLQIEKACVDYFKWNPYDAWFKELDSLLGGISSYYHSQRPQTVCHLDLIPYATSCKWTDLSSLQRVKLLAFAGDTLGLLLRDSPVMTLVLNGQTVVRNVEMVSGTSLEQREIPSWILPRKTGLGVRGISYSGSIRQVNGVDLGRDITVLGFNHNIQSSFGVTKEVKAQIRCWISNSIREVVS